MIRIATILLLFTMMLGGFGTAATAAQDAPQQPSDEQQAKEKAALEKKALALLEQVVAEAPSLKLPENRIRIQITSADLLWKRDQARARILFSQAAEGVAELVRIADSRDRNQRPTSDQMRTPIQLRQELVMTIARYDGPLAYQALASTRSLTPPAENALGQIISPDDNLEQMLLSRIAALDPKLALQNAEQFLDKGEFPRSLSSVLSQLQQKDKEAAAKLETKLVQRLQSANMLAKIDAGNLAMTLLTAGPRPASTSTDAAKDSAAPPAKPSGQLLSESNYQDLMLTLVEAALKAAPAPAGQRGGNAGRARGANTGRAGQGLGNVPTTLSDAEIEQVNARRLLSGVQSLLPKIDQYLPERAQPVRQKLSEVGMGNEQRGAIVQAMTALNQGNADSLIAAAPSAPAALQSRIYQQAAYKALEEGNADRARAIATDHLDSRTRASVIQSIDFRQMADKVEASNIESVRLTVANLSSDSQRIELLLQLSAAALKKNAKLSRQLLDEAQRLTSRPAVNYQEMEAQIRVARGFAALDPARSFQILEPGIMQLNELLSAAAVLNGFEVNVFRDGELPLQGGSGLGTMVNRYAQELAVLAKSDFERAQTLVNRFQLAEPRIQARLAIALGVLRPQPVQPADNGLGFRNFGQNFPIVRQPR